MARAQNGKSSSSAPGSNDGLESPAANRPLPTNGIRYRMVERLIKTDDDFYIQTDRGLRVYKIDGNAIRTNDTFRFEDLQGNVLCAISLRLASIRDAIHVTDAQGDRLASVQRRAVTPIRDSFFVELADGPNLKVQGNIATHEYELAGPEGIVAAVSKRWFRARDSYGVEIAPGQHDVRILAAVVALDQMVGAPM